VTISEVFTGASPVSGYGVAGQQVEITAPAASVAAPLILEFLIDASALPGGTDPNTLQVTRIEPPNPTPTVVQPCSGADATPDPCVVLPNQVELNGNIKITVRTSHASLWNVIVPMHDTVVLPVWPVNVTVGRHALAAAKHVRVKVRNADIVPMKEAAGHHVLLDVQPGNCPPAIFGAPDFDSRHAGAQSDAVIAGGKTKTATIPLLVPAGLFASLNAKAPTRCTFTVTVSTDVVGNHDPSPDNDTVAVELNVVDLSHPPPVATHESVLSSLAPVTVTFARNVSPPARVVKVKIGNADLGETAGDDINVMAFDGTCPAGTVGAVDFDRSQAGPQPDATVVGGKRVTGRLRVTIDPLAFHTANAQSPARCTAQVVATGPSGNADPDPSNNAAQLVIDVIDKGDF